MLINFGRYRNRAVLRGIVTEATDPFDKALISVAAINAHIKP